MDMRCIHRTVKTVSHDEKTAYYYKQQKNETVLNQQSHKF